MKTCIYNKTNNTRNKVSERVVGMNTHGPEAEYPGEEKFGSPANLPLTNFGPFAKLRPSHFFLFFFGSSDKSFTIRAPVCQGVKDVIYIQTRSPLR